MPNGYCPAIVTQIGAVAGGNAPGTHLAPAGFLKMLFCCQNSSVSPINANNENGHTRPMTVVYRKRPTVSLVRDTDTCDIDGIPNRDEWTIPGLLHREVSFFISDKEISKYCQEASAPAAIGGVRPTGFMQEHLRTYFDYAAILLQSVNTALVSLQSTKFGENLIDHSALGRVVNINRSGADFALDDGMVAFLAEIKENEICDTPCLVGGGLIERYDMARLLQCCTAAGINVAQLPFPQLFPDRDTQTLWGANSFGVFAKGSVKFLSADKYVGDFAGEKGNSTFFNVAFPVQEFECADMAQCLRDLSIDVQVRYIDCPTEILVNGTPQTVNRGWQVILSKEFGLWTQPTTGYADGDPLEGTNGTLKYYATNVAGSPGIETYDPTP